MKASQFAQAASLAKSEADFSAIDDSAMYGCALSEFAFPVFVTIEQVAKFIRYQALQLDGKFDAEELASLAGIFRRKFMLIE